jgi:hypothetical protein
MIYHYDEQRFVFVDAATDRPVDTVNNPEAAAVAERLRLTLASYIELVARLKAGFEQADFSEKEKEDLRRIGYLQ